MENQPPSTSDYQIKVTVQRFGSLAALVGLYWCIHWVGGFYWIGDTLRLSQKMILPELLRLFEHHVWQFLICMVVIAVLSRGNLWSFGINSVDVRKSIRILVRFYAFTFVAVAGMVFYSWMKLHPIPAVAQNASMTNLLGWIILQWMVAAIADVLLFQGIFQTISVRTWNDHLEFGSIKIPVAVLFSTIAFAFGRVNVTIYGSATVDYVLCTMVGFYCGTVYSRTRSLLAPMLSVGFFYGLPFIFTLVSRLVM